MMTETDLVQLAQDLSLARAGGWKATFVMDKYEMHLERSVHLRCTYNRVNHFQVSWFVLRKTE